jgi:uncharacterized membrane protein (UPF0127 family)
VSVEVPIRFRRRERVEILGLEVPVATRFAVRLMGLALLRRERAGAGLLIPGCRSVHTFGMRFPLDLFFLDGEHRVIEVRREVPPSRFVHCADAEAVLELPSPGGERSRKRP